jgi:UDP-N-acetylglucosamine 1-carboxyvinyltransferase
MEKIVVNGGNPLYGNIYIDGMKNAALPIIFSCILIEDKCVIENLPDISDIRMSLAILQEMGATVRLLDRTTAEIDCTNLIQGSAPYEMVSKIRGSTYILGAEIGRFGSASVGCPGGCNFISRPINYHVKAFNQLGAEVYMEDSCYRAIVKDTLRGSDIQLDFPSVGATINIIIAAVLAEGKTTISNAAREPHIVELANFLNICGANILGAGTSEITIHGVKKLHGASHTIIPDMIEAGTYMAAVAAAGGRVNICNIIPKHVETVTAKLLEMGCEVEVADDSITVISDGLKTGMAAVKAE